ncbi:hypothetical protein J4732_08035 [Serratia marcescens]|uniref:Uncharacterized protein n=1 Tax=Serratia marcescens TaxID=615 RepID=A0A939NJQ7_SERMA|nr:hypothetical protein [Serratia marcescens]
MKVEAVSRREYDDARRTANRARQRGVCRADVRTAQQSGVRHWRAPIGGRIGKSTGERRQHSRRGARPRPALIQQMDHLCGLHPARQHCPADARGHGGRQAVAVARAPQAVSISVDGTRYTAKGRLKFSDHGRSRHWTSDPAASSQSGRHLAARACTCASTWRWGRISRPSRAPACHPARHRRHGPRNDDPRRGVAEERLGRPAPYSNGSESPTGSSPATR